jgi:large subunit ribosomal protein L13
MTKIERKVHKIDAEGQVLGRLATQIASILRGKHKPEFQPHIDGGDIVEVINADKIKKNILLILVIPGA